MNAMQGITFEKDATGANRYIRIDLQKYAQTLQPFLHRLGIVQYPEGWEDGLTSEEFLAEVKTMLRKKFDAGNKIS